MEYRVINFDFYNDWINGTIYIPRFMRYFRPKKTFLGIRFAKAKIKGCMDDTKIFSKTRRYTQLCSLGYKSTDGNMFTMINNPLSKSSNKKGIRKSNNFHKQNGFTQHTIFGKKGGICHEHTTSRNQYVYYMKPCEWSNNSKVNLFATDLILLGSLKDCDENGLPKAFRYLSSTSYIMPTNLALTNMESNGQLYANNKNTICAGQSNQIINDDSVDDKGVQMVSPNSGLSMELEVYAKSKDSNIDTKYDGNELSDIIALTEASGSAWNYTGPGQGEIVEKNMYYPGGHFLGMSCVNSQTNIKSCINLSRICELGATMSQRKEDISSVDENGNITYTYTAPTGFISGNEIISEDFRTMFATMNQKRLQATNINNETGYKYYDFDFVKPINFNGVFKDIINKGKTAYYNTKIEVPEEDGKILEKYGISYDNKETDRPDYDKNERMNTQTRTIEEASEDYYKFRFGLSNENLNKNDVIHKSRFLKMVSGYNYLPQYENSYYFYFGMKAGATAIDEFNKQFYSVCEPTILTQRLPIINVNINNIDMSLQKGEVQKVLDNIELPLRLLKYSCNYGDGITETDVTVEKNNIDGGYYRERYINNFELPFGNYHLEAIDSNGIYLSKDFSIGVDLFSFRVDTYNFNVYNAKEFLHKNSNVKRDMFIGGYFDITDSAIKKEYIDKVGKTIKFIIKLDNEVIDTSTAKWGETVRLYANEANIPYKLYISYELINGGFSTDIYMGTYYVNDGQSANLNIGWKNIPLYVTVTPNGPSKIVLLDKTIEDKEPFLNFGDNNGEWWNK